ncbi:hypothetical protein ASG06_17590 [Rathayibacter sp. Leaf185]|nr:hypothetical protein ASF42_18800 [Rathayibacter sp. Leaf294]KQS08552.1 hypothetical protein ASG06_17590 [Rathayibacter sp. Leaf185]
MVPFAQFGLTPQRPMEALIAEKSVPTSKITRMCTPSDEFASKPGRATMPFSLAAAIRPAAESTRQWSVTAMREIPSF